MKIIFLCLFLISGNHILIGQILHEHSYQAEDFTQRVNFPTYGEKYCVIDESNAQIHIHNKDHSLWKTISLSLPVGSTDLALAWVNEQAVNPDSLLEMGFRYRFNNAFHTRVIDEAGLLLLDLPNTSQVYLNKIDGLQDKLIVTGGLETKVYELPFLNLEHTYNNFNIERVNLAYSGEKYYWLNRDNGELYLHNADHSLWKIVTITPPANCSINSMRSLSQSKIVPDSLLEIVYIYRDTTIAPNGTEDLINENGTVLLRLPSAYYLYVSEIDGLPNKLIGVNSSGSKIYEIPSLNLEHTYPKTVRRIKLGLSGEKYYYHDNNMLTLNNSNHTLWKNISLGSNFHVQHISENKIFSDSLLEIGYGYSSNYNPGHPSINYVKIMNENGVNFLTVNDAYHSYINQLDTLSTKIITNMSEPNCCYSQVYSVFDYNNIVNLPAPNTIKTYPNPASKWLTVENPNLVIKNLKLLDVKGRLLRQITSEEETVSLDVSNLAAGIYFIKGEDKKGNQYLEKIIIGKSQD